MYNIVMFTLILSIITRIFSNSYLNVLQKILTKNGEFSSIVNLFTYLGLGIIAFIICPKPIFDITSLPYILLMGSLGAIGNYFIIKALSTGELSSLAPINSYKPLIALLVGFFFLNEIPGVIELFGIFLILIGTIILANTPIFYSKATLYRFLALILLGTEAVFIKKVILLTDINSAFLYWVISGLIFAYIFAIISKHKIKIKNRNLKHQFCLIILVFLMQYTTNYVFSRMNVSYALALFQLSSLISVFLGINIFKEKDILRKAIASTIMIIGATFIILKNYLYNLIN